MTFIIETGEKVQGRKKNLEKVEEKMKKIGKLSRACSDMHLMSKLNNTKLIAPVIDKFEFCHLTHSIKSCQRFTTKNWKKKIIRE